MTVVLLDVGGVLVLPDFAPVASLLRRDGRLVTGDAFDRAHYAAVGAIDVAFGTETPELVDAYVSGFSEALGYGDERTDVSAAVEKAFTTSWPRVIESSVEAMRELNTRGCPIAIVSNSLGTVEEGLRGICQVGEGPGATVEIVIDSFNVGLEKPDPRIFALALDAVGADPSDVLHVGDSVVYDVRGAEAAGLRGFHFDPWLECRADDHKHVVSLWDVVDTLGAR